MLQKKIDEIREKIIRAGGNDVTLIAVTKTHPPEVINEAIDCGVTDIGENKVQEILAKYDSVKPVRWHLIGHLQTNKVRQIVDKVCMIHSLDSMALANEIEKRCANAGITMDVLVQVNMAGEESKFGLAPGDVEAFTDEVIKLPHLRLRGLMQIAPYSENPEDVRIYFKETKEMFDALHEKYGEDFNVLSMGMSNDFVQAVEEGATHVRVGTAIFGERDYSKKEGELK